VTVEEAVAKAVAEAAAILMGRGQRNFYGSVEVKYQADRIVMVEVRETIRK